MVFPLDQETIDYLLKVNLVDASDSTIRGSYTKDTHLVSDSDEFLMKNPSSVKIKGQRIVVEKPDSDFLQRVDRHWRDYEETDNGRQSFRGPVISVSGYHVDLEKAQLSLTLSLITYAEFLMSYLTEFDEEEKGRNYSLGVTGIVRTGDDRYVFGVRSKGLSPAGGTLECIQGFLDLASLIDGELYEKIDENCRKGKFWKELGKSIPHEIDIIGDLQEACNTELYQEIGLRREDIASSETIYFHRKDLYQNYGLLNVVKLSLTEEEVRDRFSRYSDGEPESLVFVPEEEINTFIRGNKDRITSNMRSALRAYLIG